MGRIFLLLLLVLTSYDSLAQICQVRARVVNRVNQEVISNATVVAYIKADSSYFSGGLTDSLGFFTLKLKTESYILDVSHIGYEKRLVSVDIVCEDHFIDDIELDEQVVNLDEVVVQGYKSPALHKDDKTIYRIDDMPLSRRGTVDDVLKTLPSITQDFNGETLINGVPAQFLIDGRELSSSELDAYSPSQIESIEIVSNPTSKYDADGLSGIIHLRSKKNKKSGISAALNMSETEDAQSGSLSFVYNKDKLSLTANAVASNIYQHGSIETITENSTSTNGVEATIINILANIGGEYNFTEYNSLSVSYQYVNFGYKAIDFSQSREGVTDMRGVTHQIALTHNYLLGSSGDKITTNVYYNQSMPETISYLDYLSEGEFIIDNKNRNSSLVAMVDYLLPFTEYANFEAGIKSQTRNIDILREDDFTGVNIADNYSFRESILGVYMLMNSRMERFNFQFGIRGESDLLNQEDNIREWNMFPHLSFDYTDQVGAILKVGYNSRISRPTAADLNPFLMLIDPTSQFQGDPTLKAEYSHNFYADYILKRDGGQVKFSTYYRLVKNLITKNYSNIDDGMVLYRPINISHAHFYGTDVTATLREWKHLSLTPNLGLEYVKLPSEYASEIRSVKTINVGLNLGLQLSNNIDFGALVRYSSGSFSVGSSSQSAIVQGLAIGLPLIYSELSAGKGFFEDRLNVSLRITDPFNIQQNGFMVYSDGSERESRYLMQTRFTHIGVSYRMNNHKSVKRKYDDGGINIF